MTLCTFIHRMTVSPNLAMLLFMVVLLILSLSSVDSQCSEDASCICSNETYWCSNSGLTQLPQDIPASVTLINISSNAIVTLEENAFIKFQTLETLVLTNTQLERITPNVFSNLPALTTLYLDGNRLTTLEVEITGSPNLQILDLSSNPIVCDDRLRWLASIPQLRGTCKSGETLTTYIASLSKPNSQKNKMNDTNLSKEDHHPSATRIYTVSIVLPILLVAFVCTIFVAIIVYRNKQKEAKYNSSVRYSAVQKDRGGGRVYDDVTTEL